MPSALRSRQVVTTVLVLPLVTGCFTYTSLPVAGPIAPSPGSLLEVRISLTPEGAVALTEAAGVRLQRIEGRLEERLADSALVLRPATMVTVNGDELPWRRGTLTVPLRAVARADQRVLDRKRTRNLAITMVAAFTGVVTYALKSIGGWGGATIATGPGAPE